MYKILLISFIALFVVSAASAQSVLTPALSDTLNSDDVEERSQVVYLKDTDKPATAVIEKFYGSGQIQSRRSVVNGQAEGIWMEWYETGILRYIAEWKNGMGHGQWIYFHENGEIRERSLVEKDLWQGITEGWHPNGVKAFEGMHVQNERIGRWTWWDELGAITESKTYQNR